MQLESTRDACQNHALEEAWKANNGEEELRRKFHLSSKMLRTQFKEIQASIKQPDRATKEIEITFSMLKTHLEVKDSSHLS